MNECSRTPQDDWTRQHLEVQHGKLPIPFFAGMKKAAAMLKQMHANTNEDQLQKLQASAAATSGARA